MIQRQYMLVIISLVAAISLSACVHADPERKTYTTASVEQASEAQLDQLLAPIALYPDTVLSQILIASTYPLEIVQAQRFLNANPTLEGAAAVAATDDQDWDPSVKSLTAFRHLIDRMSNDLAWTQQLGDAFLDDEAAIMDSIQRLRSHAYNEGSLDKLEHVRVEREQQVIIIEPAEERIVYVPVYDTRVVYGSWWWPDYPPYHWQAPAHVSFSSGFYWGPSIYVGSSFFYSSFYWPRHHIVYVDRHHRRPHHFGNSHSIIHHQHAHRWQHNPSHRRGVEYRGNHARQQFQGNRHYNPQRYQQRVQGGSFAAPSNHRGSLVTPPKSHGNQSTSNRREYRQPETERIRERLNNPRQPSARAPQNRGEQSLDASSRNPQQWRDTNRNQQRTFESNKNAGDKVPNHDRNLNQQPRLRPESQLRNRSPVEQRRQRETNSLQEPSAKPQVAPSTLRPSPQLREVKTRNDSGRAAPTAKPSRSQAEQRTRGDAPRAVSTSREKAQPATRERPSSSRTSSRIQQPSRER